MPISSALTTTSFQVVLNEAAIVQPYFECYYRDVVSGATPVIADTTSSTNGTTAVTIMPAPLVNHTRTIGKIIFRNNDSIVHNPVFQQLVSGVVGISYAPTNAMQPGDYILYDVTYDTFVQYNNSGVPYNTDSNPFSSVVSGLTGSAGSVITGTYALSTSVALNQRLAIV